jgi:ABC-2 type transport system permease protein
MDRAYQIAKKEFIQVFRDPRMLLMIFLVPILQLFLFGYAVTNEVRNITLAVMDRDLSRESRTFLSGLAGSGYFRIVTGLDTEEDLVRALVFSKADMALVIPRGFARDLARGETAELQIILDGSESNSSTVGLAYLKENLAAYSEKGLETALGLKLAASGARLRSLPRVEPETRFLYNPELKSSHFFVPGVIAMTTMIQTILLTSLAITREREVGTIEQLVVTPLRSHELMIGKMLPFAIIGLVDIALILPVAAGHFHLPMAGSVPLLFGAGVVFFFSTLGVALLVSTLCRTQQQAIFVTFLVLLPGVLLSGLLFPISNMPRAVQYLTYFNPLRYFLTILRGIILKGNSFPILAPQFLMMGLLGFFLFGLAASRFRRNID